MRMRRIIRAVATWVVLPALGLAAQGQLEERFDGQPRWQARTGTWRQANGVLSQMGQEEGFATVPTERLSNLSVRVRARLPKDVVEGYAGIAFGLDEQGTGWVVYLARHLKSQRDNLVKLRRLTRGHVGDANLAWVKHPIERGTWHELRVETAAGRVRVDVDGKRLFTHHVGRPIAGGIGLWTLKSAVDFDDLRVGPSGLAPRGGRPKRFARVNPIFPSVLRKRLVLDGEWQFRMDPEDKGQEEGWAKGEVDFPDTIRVPGAWEAQGFGGEKIALRYQGTPVCLRGSYRGAAWYRKSVTIPADWKGKRVWLKLGGVQPSALVWCNGVYLGFHDRYFEPFKFDVTDLAKPGETCTVVARIDNRDQPASFGQGGGAGGCLTILWPWGGIHRSVELEATAPVAIQRVEIVPDLDRCVVDLKVHLEDEVEATKGLALAAHVLPVFNTRIGLGGTARTPVTQQVASLSVPVKLVRAWSPEAPHLYKLDVAVVVGDQAIDLWSDRFGFCKREVRGNDVFLNNRQVFVRGYGNDCVYPLTLAPPASRDFYRKRFKLARAYGFTYTRHHTWVPLPEYFDAADEVGIMLQPELPYGGPPERMDALIANYRNHPSLATYSMTNEKSGGSAELARLYRHAKAADPTRFAIDSDGSRGPVRDTSDLWLIYGTPPDTDPAFRTKPVLYHEFLNLPTIADPAALTKFTGGFKPTAMADLAAYAKAKGREEEVRAAVQASRYLQKLLQKDGIERARRQRELDGYCYWTIADFWEFGQGLFDVHWEPKGWTAAEFRRFNDAACLLAELPAHTAWQGAAMEVKLLVSNYTGSDIRGARLAWALGDGSAAGKLDGVNAPHGTVSAVGTVRLTLPELRRHAHLPLRCTLTWGESKLENEWDLWTFSKAALATRLPAKLRFRGRAAVLGKRYAAADAGPEVLVAEALEATDQELLRRGGRMLLVSTASLKGQSVRLHPGWWRPKTSEQVGLAMRRHPALEGFPHDGAAGFQIASILRTVVTLDKQPLQAVPIVYGLTYPFPRMPMSQKKLRGEPPELRACLFEYAVGKGRVVVSGLDLLAVRPESVALADCLLRYVSGARPPSEDAPR